MRTSIVLDDDLVCEAMQDAKARTKRGSLEAALQTLTRVKAEYRRRQSCRQRLQALQERLGDLRPRRSAHDLIREDRRR